MQIIGDIFNFLFYGPIVNILIFIIRLLEASSIPGATGIAIIVMTIVIRLLVWPLMSTQLKSAKKMADLKPHLDLLKEKHKGDKQGLAQAQMALYKEHGVNPAGGCLPALLQIPILIALYQAISTLFSVENLGHINYFLYNKNWILTTPPDPNFLGFNLAVKPSEFASYGLFLLLVPIVTALLQFIQSKMMAPKGVKVYPSDSPREKKDKEEVEDTMAAVQSQMLYMMPLMIGFFSWQFPIGLAIYWNTFTVLGIIQQYQISGWGGLDVWIDKYLKRK